MAFFAEKTEDFFDALIMEKIQHQLIELSCLSQMDISCTGNTVTFHSSVSTGSTLSRFYK